MTFNHTWIAVLLTTLGLASGCLAKPVAVASSNEPSLTEEELLTYKYILVRSTDDSVCRHMQGVYGTYFRQPWNQRPFFRTHAPDVITHWFGYSPTPPDEPTTFMHDIRYSLYPDPPEFAAIDWQSKVMVSELGVRSPIRIASADIDDDGHAELIIQQLFNGWGDRDAQDVFVVVQEESLVNLRQDTLALRKVSELGTTEGGGWFSGRIVRLLVFDDIVYISEYEAQTINSSVYQHYPPEKMILKTFESYANVKSMPMNFKTVCEFDMKRIGKGKD